MDPSAIFSWLQEQFLPLLGMLDVSSGIDPRAVLLLFLLVMLGEINLAVPFLIESIWLIVGLHASADVTSIMNALALLLVAQTARQVGITGIFHLFPFVHKPLSKLYMKPLRANRYYQKYASNDYLYNARFLSVPSATLGMMTPLCGPIKVLLILKRKLRILLIATLFSGIVFDVSYTALGAIFHTTRLSLAYLPAFMVVGFLILLLLRWKARNGLRENLLRKEV